MKDMMSLTVLILKVENRDYVPHGKLVVRNVKQNTGLYEFQKRWRKHFVETMKPSYLPKNWSIEHFQDNKQVLLTDDQL